MHLILILLGLAGLIVLPNLWTRWVLARHAGERLDYRGSGGAFARHLLDDLDLQSVAVEQTDSGDHYDPSARCVRLSKDNYDGRSLTAITVAAHEVGHAIQHARGVGGLQTRSRLVGFAQPAQRIGSGLLLGAPLLVLARVPMAGILMLFGGVLMMGSAIVVHLVTLPVEWDASFRRAMPLLRSGYLPKSDLPAARHILLACAFTYVAASLLSLVNVWRWLALLRR